MKVICQASWDWWCSKGIADKAWIAFGVQCILVSIVEVPLLCCYCVYLLVEEVSSDKCIQGSRIGFEGNIVEPIPDFVGLLGEGLSSSY